MHHLLLFAGLEGRESVAAHPLLLPSFPSATVWRDISLSLFFFISFRHKKFRFHSEITFYKLIGPFATLIGMTGTSTLFFSHAPSFYL